MTPVERVPLSANQEVLGSADELTGSSHANATARDYRGKQWIHEAFRVQTRRRPGDVAIRVDGRSLTYRELGERVNRLAHLLQERGIGRGTVVGVALERSADLVVALLATLTVGAAYLPLDPDYPDERITFMLDDSRSPLVITRSELAGRVSGSNAAVLLLDGAVDAPDRPVEVTVTADTVAYVIYTSGSTGRPKGAMITHAGLRNRIAWMQERYSLTVADRVLQKTPSSFDVSVWEFFWPLTEGACLVLARAGGHWDLDYLANVIQAEGVTVVHFVPSVLRLFLAEPAAVGCTTLRLMFCSGEALSRDLVEAVLRDLPCELHNLYGPTEATVDVTWWPCRAGDPTVPIGYPCANTSIHVLDRRGEQVPVGVAGEIHVGGIQLATGYLNRPALTAERFVPDPFSAEPGARLYRTGDLGVRRPDGAIEFLGRLDHQIKLFGNRIEIGEIEDCLSTHPGVRAAVVSVTTSTGGPVLQARVVPTAGARLAAGELIAHLKARLPSFMIPQRFAFVDRLPLTPSGKVDRRRLEEPVASAGDAAGLRSGGLADRPEQRAGTHQVERPAHDVRVFGVHGRVSRLALDNPDAVAVGAAGREVRYGELDARAAAVAERLRDVPMVDGGVVAVAVSDPVDLLVALLATYRAGAASAPLTGALPPEQRRHVLADAAAAAIVTDRAGVQPVDGRIPVIDLREVPDASPPAEPPSPPGRGVLAVVCYDTRLDRVPYGVEITHDALDSALQAVAERLSWQGVDEVLLVVRPPASAHIELELMLPLVTGGRLEIATPEVGHDPEALEELLLSSNATTMWAATSTWQTLVDGGWPGDPGLRIVCAGGVPSADLAARLHERGRAVWSVQGYTETTHWSTAVRLDRRDCATLLGSPLGNTMCQVIGPDGRLAPPGVPGELFIGGRGLSRGYRHRPDLDARSFCTIPGVAAGRLFRTGQTVSVRADGAIEYPTHGADPRSSP